MDVLDLFFKRKNRREQAGRPGVYQYDELPMPFRVQVVHIWRTSIGVYAQGPALLYERSASSPIWRSLHEGLARELGVFSLADGSGPDAKCFRFLLEEPDTDKVLSIIELSFRLIEEQVPQLAAHEQQKAGITQDSHSAVRELNVRFREHSIGYQYVNGQIMRIDSQYLHAEAVKPAISLLHGAGFTGAEEEFLCAHKHYREEEYKEAITEALKAFESTIKAVCDKRGWKYPEKAGSKQLIQVVFEKGLIPKELQSHFSALRSVLESGLPTVRNRVTPSAHGQGSVPVEVADYMAAYALHLAASNIVFLVEAHRAK